VPATFIPAYNPAVLATVTWLFALVVAIPDTVPGVIAMFAFPFNVTVVPEIPVTVRPKKLDPTSKPTGTLATVTVGLDTLLDITLAAVFNALTFAITPFAYNVPTYVFVFASVTCPPVEIPPELNTGLTFPVITELMVSTFAPLVRNNSLPPEVKRPRTPTDPMVRALLSDPANTPPLANVSVSVFPKKFTCVAPLFNVNELMVCPPATTGCVPAKRTLLVAVALANVITCSCQFIERIPTTGS
jgi:hypothetical protein